MKNANIPAMPTPVMDNGCTAHGTEPTYGLTKREVISMHVMQGIVTQGGFCNNHSEIKVASEWAVSCADALLAELERTK